MAQGKGENLPTPPSANPAFMLSTGGTGGASILAKKDHGHVTQAVITFSLEVRRRGEIQRTLPFSLPFMPDAPGVSLAMIFTPLK